MRQCDAQTLSSTYSDAHRCLKKTGIKKVGKRALCMHHRSMRKRNTSPKSGG